jgi:Ca2+-dependent lipid-binding protein
VAVGTKNTSEASHVVWLSQTPKPEEEKDIQMRVVVFKADGLAAGDVEAGTSDAYVKLRLSDTSKTTDIRAADIRTWSAKHGVTASPKTRRRRGRKAYKSPVVPSTINPTWNARAQLVREPSDGMLIVSVYDEDILTQDEFLGQAVVPLDKIPVDGSVAQLTVKLGPLSFCSRTGEFAGKKYHQDARQRSQAEAAAWKGDIGNFEVVPSGTLKLAVSCRAFVDVAP